MTDIAEPNPPAVRTTAPLETLRPLPTMSTPWMLKGRTLRTREMQAVGEGSGASVAFEVQSVIGEGGMGIVYKAVQDYPCRTVALKALKGTLAEPDLIKRFEREVNLLASLRHPGIGQLFSAGTLEDASGVRVPFMAMELVQGAPIHLYCRRNRLSVRQRLELFLKVADAVEYVHTMGIVHRDLSCRNILVSDRAEPKVLDFGLATFTQRNRWHESVATVAGHPFGTLGYMSPEQAAGRPGGIDLQTDVYALGVVLYKLLTGRHPLKLSGFSTEEALRRIQQVQPLWLSQRDRSLRGDLETIVHKALSKEKPERYGTVAALAGDVRHFLANEPIDARRPSVGYVAAKFVRRHRGFVSTVALIILSLSVGLVAALHQARRANVEAVRANAEAGNANAQARRAGVLLAQAKMAQGDALLAVAQYNEARNAYDAAWEQFDRLGESSKPAQLAIWELDQLSARPIREIVPQSAGVERIAISPDQRWLATSQGGLVEVRDLLTNTLRGRFRLQTNASGLLFSPDGQFLGCLAGDRYEVRRVSTNEPVASTDGLPGGTLWFALGNGAVATGTRDGVVTTREFGGADTPVRFERMHQGLRTMAFVKDGRLLAIDEGWRVWQRAAAGGDFTLVGVISGGPADGSGMASCAISPEGGYVATFSAKGAVVISVPDLKERFRVADCGLSKDAGFASESSVYFGNAKRDRYQVFGVDGRLRIVLPASGSALAVFAGNLAVVKNREAPLTLWAAVQDQGVSRLRFPADPTAGALSRDGRIAVLGGKDGLIRLYDAVGGHPLATLNAGAALRALRLDDAARLLVAVTQDEQTTAQESVVEFWDLATLQKTCEFPETGPIKALALARSGTLAISCVLGEKNIRIWRPCPTGWASTSLAVGFPATSIDIAPDSESVVISGDPAGVELWSMQPQPARRCLLPASQQCKDAFFAANGRLVVARDGEEKAVRFWQAQSGALLARLDCPKTPVAMAASDGQVVVFDGESLQFLNVDSQQWLRRLPAADLEARVMGLSGDGQSLLVVDRQKHVKVIDFALPARLHVPIDDMTPIEQSRWFAACGLLDAAGEAFENDQTEPGPRARTLEDAYVFWARGDTDAAFRVFAASRELSEGTRGLLLRAVQTRSATARMSSH